MSDDLMRPIYEMQQNHRANRCAAEEIDAIDQVANHIEAQAAEITRLRATRKWNIERDGDDLLICEGDHERHEGCAMQLWVKAEKVTTARREGMVEAAKIAADFETVAYQHGNLPANDPYECAAQAAREIAAAIRAAAKEVKP